MKDKPANVEWYDFFYVGQFVELNKNPKPGLQNRNYVLVEDAPVAKMGELLKITGIESGDYDFDLHIRVSFTRDEKEHLNWFHYKYLSQANGSVISKSMPITDVI